MRRTANLAIIADEYIRADEADEDRWVHRYIPYIRGAGREKMTIAKIIVNPYAGRWKARAAIPDIERA